MQGQRVAASFCAQETTSAEKRFMKQPQRLGDDFEFAFSCNGPEVLRRAKPRAFRPRKCSESGSSVMMTKGCRAFLITGSGKPRRGATKNVAAARNNDGATKNTHAQEETSPGPPPDARPLGHRSCGGAPPRPWPTRGRDICPNLDSRSKTDLETQRTEKKHAPTQSKARAREEPSPGPPASKTDARPPGHQPRGEAPARPRFSRGQEGPT